MPTNFPPDLFDVMFIPITRGKFATIDLADLHKISHCRWTLHMSGDGRMYARAYAMMSGKKTVYTSMQKNILLGPQKRRIYFQDKNTLNCRRSNLSFKSPFFPSASFAKGKSKFRGVTIQDDGRFKVRVKIANGRERAKSNFRTAREAARAYDVMAKELHGEKAILNFPEKGALNGKKKRSVYTKSHQPPYRGQRKVQQ